MEGTDTAVTVGDEVVEAVTAGRASLENIGEAVVAGVGQSLLVTFP